MQHSPSIGKRRLSAIYTSLHLLPLPSHARIGGACSNLCHRTFENVAKCCTVQAHTSERMRVWQSAVRVPGILSESQASRSRVATRFLLSAMPDTLSTGYSHHVSIVLLSSKCTLIFHLQVLQSFNSATSSILAFVLHPPYKYMGLTYPKWFIDYPGLPGSQLPLRMHRTEVREGIAWGKALSDAYVIWRKPRQRLRV